MQKVPRRTLHHKSTQDNGLFWGDAAAGFPSRPVNLGSPPCRLEANPERRDKAGYPRPESIILCTHMSMTILVLFVCDLYYAPKRGILGENQPDSAGNGRKEAQAGVAQGEKSLI